MYDNIFHKERLGDEATQITYNLRSIKTHKLNVRIVMFDLPPPLFSRKPKAFRFLSFNFQLLCHIYI